MAKIFVKYNFTGVSAPFIIATVVEHSAPLAEIDREAVTAPYEGGITFEGLNPVMHQVRFYESANGTTLGNQLVSLSIDATIYNEPQVEILTFEVDGGRGTPYFDPISGADSYTHPSLANCTSDPQGTGDKFTVFQEGLGVVDPSSLTDITNGFEFTNGYVFNPGAKFQVIIFRTVSTTPAELLSKPWVDVIEVDTNITFGMTHYNSMLVADWSGSVGTITFPAHATVPNFTRVKISAHAGAQNYVKLQFNGSQTVKFFGQNKNVLYLEKGAEIQLLWKEGVCYVLEYKGNYLSRGKVLMSYDNTSGLPYLRAHIDTGVLFKTDYPALYEYIESLPVGVAVALSAWNNSSTIAGKTKYPNRSRWGIDTLTETFRVPHLANLGVRFLKLDVTADTERVNDVPGGYQIDKIQQHEHTKTTLRTKRGSGSDPNEAQNNDTGTGFGGSYLESSGNVTLWPGGESENRMENFGQIPLIYL